jgi:hypothetical protein
MIFGVLSRHNKKLGERAAFKSFFTLIRLVQRLQNENVGFEDRWLPRLNNCSMISSAFGFLFYNAHARFLRKRAAMSSGRSPLQTVLAGTSIFIGANSKFCY